MSDVATKPLAKTGQTAAAPAATPEIWRPFETLRRQVDRLFEQFDNDPWRFPSLRSLMETEPFEKRTAAWAFLPSVDVVEKDKHYEITAELPGLNESDIDVKVANGMLTIRGEKKEEKEEKKKDYHLMERHFGAFRRSFQVPEGVDADKIEASFKQGVLTLVLPKSTEAQKQEKKIPIKAA